MFRMMCYGSAIVNGNLQSKGWATTIFDTLLPGSHLALIAQGVDHDTLSLEARLAGFILRDSLFVVSAGPKTQVIYLFRKPLEEPTVFEQVLKTGTSAIQIDSCRVRADMSEFFSATGKPRSGMGHANLYGMGGGFGGDKANPPHVDGRWPPNFLLVHSSKCIMTGTKKIQGHKGYPNGPGGKSFQYSSDKRGSEVRPNAWLGHADSEGKETIQVWSCMEECPVKLLDEQSGIRKSGSMKAGTVRAASREGVQYQGHFSGNTLEKSIESNEGGASRFYPQFSNFEEMCSWVETLITCPWSKTFRSL